jgi:hypothetical protein
LRHASQPRTAPTQVRGDRDDDGRDLPRREDVELPFTPQRALPVEIEADDIAAPVVVDRIPRQLKALQERVVETGEHRNRIARRHRAAESRLDSRWRNRRRRVEAAPLPAEKRLGPCVRIRLANDQVIAVRIDRSALISGDHPRRDAGCAQHRDESARVVLAKAATRVEKERVHRIVAEQRRRKGIEEGLLVERREHGFDVAGVVGCVRRSSRANDRVRGFALIPSCGN